MRLEVACIEGVRRDLLLELDRTEIEAALLSVANRADLMALPGIVRHRGTMGVEAQGLADSKVAIDEHLRQLGIVDASGAAVRRAVAISNRNLGTIMDTSRGSGPRRRACFACLGIRVTTMRTRALRYGATGGSIEDLRFDVAGDGIADARSGLDLSDDIEWATSGQRVLRRGGVTPIEELLHEFSDIRHVLAFDPRRPEGQQAWDAIYEGYPGTFRENVGRAWRDAGVPRARYFHNAIGMSDDGVVVVQREGTVEEIGHALAAAGGEDGIILDNGGSVVCWVWWANVYTGGIVSPTVDYRSPGTSAMAFVLKGPLRIDLPGGSVSASTY